MTTEQECEMIDRIFYEAFLDELKKHPGWCSYIFKAPIEQIQADPERYYNAGTSAPSPASSPTRVEGLF
jgi:hypothetical protein